MGSDVSPGSLTNVTDPLALTRQAWHQVAEHVVAPAQYAEAGRIELAPAPGGFSTTYAMAGGRSVSVDGADIVITDRAGRRAQPLSTIAAAAAFIGRPPGLPPEVYPPATALRPDEPLVIDAASARLLADWFAVADQVLRELAGELGAADEQPVLWPEHFDIAITVGEVNYGASPGDDGIAAPYFYVGPYAGPPVRDEFWNAPFGAARTNCDISTAAQALDFLRDGHRRLVTGR